MANEKRLIDANALLDKIQFRIEPQGIVGATVRDMVEKTREIIKAAPTVDAVEVVHGRWILTANEEHSNCRWNVTAECSKCHHSKGEIYAGFFPGVPKDLARDIILDSAESVKMDNYCPNCGADMRGEENG